MPTDALISRQSTMSQAKPSAKKPRPVYSKSEPFEAAYVTFMEDVFDKDVHSLVPVETADAKMVVMADACRLRLDKKTRLLHCEYLTPASDTTPETWEAGNFPISSFWASDKELASAIQFAWQHRLTWFVPSADICYPTETWRSAEGRWLYALSQAASRRLGGRADQQRVVKRFIALLWNFLADRETLKLCHAYFGRKASLTDYNFTVRRQGDLAARFSETPNLAPLIGTFIKNSTKLKTGKYRIPQDVLSQARGHLFTPQAECDALTPAGWRFLASLTPTAVATLWRGAGSASPKPGSELMPVLNLVSKTGERPPLTFLKRLQEELRNLRHRVSAETFAAAQDSLVRFIRLSGQQAIAAGKKGRLKRFLSGDFVLVMDWLKQRERYDYYEAGYRIATVPKNATWASIMRAQQVWHAELEERERLRREADALAQREYLARRDATTWLSALPACEVKGASVMPLVSGKALREEGERMGHCVGSYVDYCYRGDSRIFAIKHLDEEATLELVESGTNQWRVRQVFGPKNSPVSNPIEGVAKTVAKMYQTAAREARIASAP